MERGKTGVAPYQLIVAALSAAVAWARPFVAQPALRERDPRVRTHTGALGAFYLDALRGLVMVIMALVTTIMTGPLLALFGRPEPALSDLRRPA